MKIAPLVGAISFYTFRMRARRETLDPGSGAGMTVMS